MIRLTVSYPSSPDATFDHEYYRDVHVPLCLRAWGLDEAEIDHGITGPNVAAVHARFPSVEALQSAMSGELSAQVIADVANYTSIDPVLQISEIVG